MPRPIRLTIASVLAAVLLPTASAVAQEKPAAPAPRPPALIVAISVDQFSGDLFAQYREHFTGGLARLLQGAVFPNAYQGHAATETCPGHSTLMTGVRPARTGIVANYWFDPGLARADKRVYCAEDERDPASTSANPVVSAYHLKVPTLGDRVKAVSPGSLNVAVSGKDRAVVMMGGHAVDAGYWWKGNGFTSFAGRTLSPSAEAENRLAQGVIARGAPAMAVPRWCQGHARALDLGKVSLGAGRFAMERTRADQFQRSPRLDNATVSLALRLTGEMELGKRDETDVLSVSLSATDYIGHGLGNQGLEMCIQMAELDKAIGRLLAGLDARKLDYMVVLSADHGGIDLPERLDQQAYPRAVRADAALLPDALAVQVTARTGISVPSGKLLYADGPFGDYYISASLSSLEKARVSAALVGLLKAHPQVAAVFTAQQLAETPPPTSSPQEWTLQERARQSFDPRRSGDVVALLDRAVVPIPVAAPGYLATHGSPWDYDRRVPLLFWKRGMAPMEQPAPVETVDIAPTLSSLIGLDVAEGDYDGRCLDVDAGPGNSCENGL